MGGRVTALPPNHPLQIECGTFTLTDAEKQAIIVEAIAQQKARAERMPDDATAVRAITDGVHRLHELGWRDAMYAPKDGSPLRLIEAGSSGIHQGYRDAEGRFWIDDGDTWPSQPILWKPA
jgi:hypothetical protein